MSGFSRNPFALLSEETDGAAPGAAKSTTAAAPPRTIPGQAPKKPQQQNQRGGRGDYPSRGGARNVYKTPEAPEAENGREDRGDRGRGRGATRGGPRGAGRGRGRGGFKNDRPDRHSQTGVHDTDKRTASGWGAEEGNSQLQAEKEGEGDAKATGATDAPATGDGWDAPAGAPAAGEDPWAAGADGAGESKAVEEEVDNSKTYEEYLAERAAAVKLAPAKAARQANEGTDDSQWKDGVQLVREANDDDIWFMGVKAKKEGSSKKSKNEKTFIDIEPQGYRPPRSDRGDRGGRGGRGRGESRGESRGEGRGRGGGAPRGAPRGARGGFGGRGGPTGLDPEDSNAFPSLS